MPLKVLEHYVSVQGEGPKTGVMTQFIRFAGCNMRCPGWPCDTQHAIVPALYIGKYKNLSSEDLFQQIYDMYDTTGARNICFTGGEPFIQAPDQFKGIVDLLLKGSFEVEVFTNGSHTSFPSWVTKDNVSLMMDWKLEGSGEAGTGVTTRRLNAIELFERDGIKFVCKDQNDLEHALRMARGLRHEGCKATFWIGTAWDQLTEAQIVTFMTSEGLGDWRLNVQVHKYIWDPNRILV